MDTLTAAQSWSVEKNIASFFLELLRSVSTFIDLWIDFYNTNSMATYNIQFPNTDFWRDFIQPAICSAITDKLGPMLV